MRPYRHFVPGIILVLFLVACNLPGRVTPTQPPAASPSADPVNLAPTPSQTLASARTEPPSARLYTYTWLGRCTRQRQPGNELPRRPWQPIWARQPFAGWAVCPCPRPKPFL